MQDARVAVRKQLLRAYYSHLEDYQQEKGAALNEVIIFIGGFLGAVARFQVGQWVGQRTSGGFPYGTLVINTLGCLFIGLIVSRFSSGAVFNFLDVGFTAAFTTFSTFSYETWRLIEEKLLGLAFLNVLFNVGLGLAGVEIGLLLGRV